MEDLDMYVIYSVDKEMYGQALYPDDPRIIEALVLGWTEAEKVVYYLRGKDSSRLYGCECWEAFDSADDFIKTIEELEEEDDR